MRFDVVTIFPEMFSALTHWGVTGRAFEQKANTAVGTWSVKGDRTTELFASSDDVQAAIQNKSANLVDARDAPVQE